MHLNNEYILIIPSFIVIRIPPQCSHFIPHENNRKQFTSELLASSAKTFIAPQKKRNDLEEYFLGFIWTKNVRWK